MILRNTIYNLLGLGLPLVVAVATIPALISILGADRFGVLTLIWAVVSYFGLFDLGIGRALTQRLSECFAREDHDMANSMIATGLAIMLLLGLLVGLILAVAAESLVRLLDGVANREEIVDSVYVLSASVPLIVLTSGLRGILEARQQFGVINAIRLPMGIYTFAAPYLAASYWSNSLTVIAAVLVFGRLAAFIAHWLYCRIPVPGLLVSMNGDKRVLSGLLGYGGYITLSNIISPLMGYADRFVIGAIISVSAVTYYVTPYEIITKLWIIPAALTAVLFPQFAQHHETDSARIVQLFRRGLILVYVVIFPVTLALAYFSHEILSLWIDAEFAGQSYRLLQVFSIGILINCLAFIPLTHIQGVGRANITAIIHVIQFPFYLLLLWWLIGQFGLMGAAWAWLLRIILDSLAMFVYSGRLVGVEAGRAMLKYAWTPLLAMLPFAGLVMESLAARMTTWFVAVILAYMLFWFVVFGAEDRLFIRTRLASVRSR